MAQVNGRNFHVVRAGSFNPGLSSAAPRIFPCTLSSGQQPSAVTGGYIALAALPGRRVLRITNEDSTQIMRIGDAAITSGAGGQPIFPRQTIEIEACSDAIVYCVSDTGTPLCSYLEAA